MYLKKGLGMVVRIASKNSTAILLAYHLTATGYCTYWQEYGVNFVSGWSMFSQQEETEKLHIPEVTGMRQTYECDTMPIFRLK